MPELIRDLSGLSLEEIARMAGDKTLPPLEKWNPPYSGDSHIRIARDGRWYHRDGLISRENLVRLFSSILRREPDGSFALVTPIEKQSVEVEDAPFIAVEAKSEGAGQSRAVAFRLNIGEMVVADKAHPLRFVQEAGEPAPYLLVRTGLEARLARPVFYQLAEWALEDGADPPGVWSKGSFFSMAALA